MAAASVKSSILGEAIAAVPVSVEQCKLDFWICVIHFHFLQLLCES